MKKIILILCMVILGVYLIGCKENENMIFKYSIDDVTGINITDPSGHKKTVTNTSEVFNIISKLRLKKIKLNDSEIPDGFAFIIEMQFRDGTNYTIICLSKKICINRIWYNVEDEYVERLRKIYNELI